MTHTIFKRVLRMLNEIMHMSKWIVTTKDSCNCFDKLLVSLWTFLCMHACGYAQSLSPVQLFVTPWTVAHQAPLSMEFSRQEYWSMLPFPTPGNLPNPGIKPTSLASPALAGRLFITALSGKRNTIWYHLYVKSKNMKQMNEYNKTEQTYRYREQTSGYQWEERAR